MTEQVVVGKGRVVAGDGATLSVVGNLSIYAHWTPSQVFHTVGTLGTPPRVLEG